jgi:hypothetical protein
MNNLDKAILRMLAASNAMGVESIHRLLSSGKDGFVSKKTVFRHIEKLIADGEVVASGDNRGRKYGLARHRVKFNLSQKSLDVLSFLDVPHADRPVVAYDFDFIHGYVPNKTFYLPETGRRQLAELGQADDHTVPGDTFRERVLARFLIDLSWASSRLEGNTYDYLDARRLIEFGEAASGKNLEETQMILNHKRAIELLVRNKDAIGLNPYSVFNVHAALSENLLPNPQDSGRIRRMPVEIGGSRYIPMVIPQVIEETFRTVLDKAGRIIDPLEQSFFTLVHLSYLQPFIDVNKRTARICCNIPFIKTDLCPVSFIEMDKELYIKSLLSIYEHGETRPLVELFLHSYEMSCVKYLAFIPQVPDIDPFVVSVNREVHAIVKQVVLQKIPEENFNGFIIDNFQFGENASKVTDIVKRHVMGLHEGNVMRYGIDLTEFQEWENARPTLSAGPK